MGLGAVAEIAELFAVLFFAAGEQVGGYLNNAFDLVFNLLGGSSPASSSTGTSGRPSPRSGHKDS